MEIVPLIIGIYLWGAALVFVLSREKFQLWVRAIAAFLWFLLPLAALVFFGVGWWFSRGADEFEDDWP